MLPTGRRSSDTGATPLTIEPKLRMKMGRNREREALHFLRVRRHVPRTLCHLLIAERRSWRLFWGVGGFLADSVAGNLVAGRSQDGALLEETKVEA